MSERLPYDCGEARQKWFDMAQRVYVQGGEPMSGDGDVGMHMAGCPTDECALLRRAYQNILRPNTLSVHELSISLDSLKRQTGIA